MPESVAQIERRLVRRAKRGDEQAFRDLCDMHSGTIFNYSRKYGNLLAHDESLGLAKSAVFQSLKNYRVNKGFRFMTYAGRVIASVVMRHNKDAAKHADRFLSGGGRDDARQQIAEERDGAAEVREEILTRLDHLRPSDAAILRMRFGIDCKRMTLKEVGAKIGLSQERIRQIQNRALRELREKVVV